MKTLLTSCLLFIVAIQYTIAQEKSSQEFKTIIEDYSAMLNKSNSYEAYKIVKFESLQNFKQRLSDELKTAEEKQISLNEIIKSQEEKINSLSLSLKETQAILDQINKEKNSMFLFGIPISKIAYQVILYFIIGLLILSLVLVLSKFKANNHITMAAHKSLKEVEANFEEYKKRALETQQKLGRELQDYKNKLAKLKNS